MGRPKGGKKRQAKQDKELAKTINVDTLSLNALQATGQLRGPHPSLFFTKPWLFRKDHN